MKNKSSNKNLFEILNQLFRNLTSKRKKQSIVLIFLITFAAIAETISLASAVPFLRIVTNSDQIWDIKFIRYLSNIFNLTDPNQLLLPIFIAFALTALLASTIKSLNLWFGTRLSANIGSDLSYEAFKKNLYQPYQFHISQNSSKLISINSVQINIAADVIDYTARFFSSTIIASFIVIYLFSYTPKETFFALIVFLISYLILGKSTKNRLDRNSYIFSSKSKSQIQIMQEAKGSIRDIILKSNYPKYLDIYHSIDIPMRRSTAENGFLSLYPKFILEGISLLTIALLAYKISFQNNIGNGEEIDLISRLGTLAIGAQKLLPNMQQSYGSWAYINGSKSSILNVLKMINKPININLINNKVGPIQFNETIKITNLGFKYPNSNKYIFRNINLTIKKGEKIGIIGETGSGKSTLIDIIMGLLHPNEGTIEVDGLNIFDKNNPKILMSWRKIISHVPQQIYLSDSNFLENIAFSNKKVISKSRVEKAARMAQIHSFINNEPQRYQTNIGENGINLSGGQRQRIGIARALYDDSKILVLDEATSALDNEIENKVMRSIYTNNNDKTLIIIAHRKNTINLCDRVIKLTKNKLILTNKE